MYATYFWFHLYLCYIYIYSASCSSRTSRTGLTITPVGPTSSTVPSNPSSVTQEVRKTAVGQLITIPETCPILLFLSKYVLKTVFKSNR